MDRISKENTQELMEKRRGPCVSIYMPAERTGREIRQGTIRLTNLLKKAEGQLRERNVTGNELHRLLEPGRRLANDEHFWKYQSDGLALFAAPAFFRYFRLPLRFEENAAVAEHFNVRPLLPLITVDGTYYLLALSQNDVRVFQGTRFSISELDVEGVPASLSEAMKYDDPELALQFRQGGAQIRGPSPGDARAALFHGQGAAKEVQKNHILRYFQMIDRGMQDLLADEDVPLILAGVSYYFPIYREASRYRHLAEEGIEGNPEHLDRKELCARAWQIIEPHFKKQFESAKDDLQQALSKSQGSTDLKQVVRTAQQGRVGTLFVARDEHQWGVFDTDNDSIQLHAQQQPTDEDLLDYAALKTYATNGVVYVVERDQMPDTKQIAAIYRY